MTKAIIPTEWVLGISEIDQEHQDLFNMFHIKSIGPQVDWPEFDDFYARLSQLIRREEEILRLERSTLEQYKLRTDASLKTLITLKEENSPNLKDACEQALLLQVARADLYHNQYQTLGKTHE